MNSERVVKDYECFGGPHDGMRLQLEQPRKNFIFFCTDDGYSIYAADHKMGRLEHIESGREHSTIRKP